MRLTRETRTGALDPTSLRLPIIALIDVVLFLLMYFMVAGTLGGDEEQLASELRKGGPGTVSSDLAAQVVSVEMLDGRPVYRVGPRILRDRDELLSLLRELPSSAGVAVKAAPDVPISATVAAIQVCRDAGFQNVGFLTPPNPAAAP